MLRTPLRAGIIPLATLLLHCPRPAGGQLKNIRLGHQHISQIYFAKPTEIYLDYSEDREELAVNPEVRGWCQRALAVLS
jgi:hypothetical protein